MDGDSSYHHCASAVEENVLNESQWGIIVMLLFSCMLFVGMGQYELLTVSLRKIISVTIKVLLNTGPNHFLVLSYQLILHHTVLKPQNQYHLSCCLLDIKKKLEPKR